MFGGLCVAQRKLVFIKVFLFQNFLYSPSGLFGQICVSLVNSG